MSGDPLKDVWPGLLKWSLAHSDGTGETEWTEMTEERKKFLEEAVREWVVDAVERMGKLMDAVKAEETDEEAVAAKEAALDALLDMVDNIDTARDFVKLGGVVYLLQNLDSASAGVAALSAEVLATLVQNNPQVQTWVMEFDSLEKLMDVVGDEERAAKVTYKSLLAISGLVREHEDALGQFLDNDGLLLLSACLAREDAKLRRRVLFMLRHILFADAGGKEMFLKLGILPAVVACVPHDDLDVRENALHVLLACVDGCPGNLAALREDDLQLQLLLSRRRDALEAAGDDAYPGEVEVLLQLQGILFGDASVGDDVSRIEELADEEEEAVDEAAARAAAKKAKAKAKRKRRRKKK
eukprot:PLAT3455.1.p1 GENE.PLAT3455.1~~PLAT3455.1.p1  ORF type:complete len:355 (+),score=186.24 PLAT3455.1:161-1225(+)